METIPNPARLAPLFQSVLYCLHCQKPTANYTVCKKCNSPAVLKLFAMIPAGGIMAKNKTMEFKLMDLVTTARQMRLATVREFLNALTITEEQAREILAGPLEPGNPATTVDDTTLLFANDAYALIAAQADPVALLPVSTIFELIAALEYGFDILTGSRLLAVLKDKTQHEHMPGEFDGDGHFLCSICQQWIHKYQNEEV